MPQFAPHCRIVRGRVLPPLLAAACALLLPGAAANAFPSQEPEKPAKIDFHQQIMPIFAKRCHECHGEEKTEGDLRTDQRSSVLDEYFVTPGKADESLLYKVIVSREDDRMPPPDEGDPVPEEEAELIKAWIDQGAEWPEKSGGAIPPGADDVRVTKTPPAIRPQPSSPAAAPAPADQVGKQPDSASNQEPTNPADTTGTPAAQAPPSQAPPSQASAAAPSPSSGLPAPAAANPLSSTQFGSAQQAEPAETKPAAADTSSSAGSTLTPRQEYWLKFWRAFGDLHPAVAHFPIALLIVGGISSLFSFRGSYACADFAFYCLWLGALGAIVASGLGWSFAWNEGYNEDPFQFDRSVRLFWHRWTGVALAILALLVALVATISRRRNPEDGSFWRLALIFLAVLTSYVGHAGGELTHRRGYGKIWDLFGWKQSSSAPAETAPQDGK